MGGYIVNFAVYTMAMLGLIFFAMMIYQKVSQNGGFGIQKSNFLDIEETLSMGPRKALYVVRAGSERFLLASDMDKTSFIAKLDADIDFKRNLKEEKTCSLDELYGVEESDMMPVRQQIKRPVRSLDEVPSIVQFPQKSQNNNGKKVIKNMLSKING